MFQKSIAILEAEAVRLGIKTTHNTGCSPVITESDLKEVVDLIWIRKDSLKEIF